jgi:hypothetical protein
MKAEQAFLAVVVFLLAALVSVLVVAAEPASLPIVVDGCFYGECNDVDNYELWGTALGDRGYLYGKKDGSDLYLAVVVSPTVNDNVFGPDGYTGSGDWSASHFFEHLEQSDNVQLMLSCGSGSWMWGVDYIYDANDGVGGYDWQSGPEGPDGDDWCSEEHGITCGYPTTITAASTLVWNVLTTTWSYSTTSPWQSPDTDGDSDVRNEEGWPNGTDPPSWYWYDSDPDRGWEWAMVYEMVLDVSQCGSSPIIVEVLSAHNSPSKDGGEDVPITLYDFGDDPDDAVNPSYHFPTLLADDGARHKLIHGGPFMGPTVDMDPNGQPTIDAVGDDEDDEADDEDGLCCWSTLVPGEDAHVYADMQGSPAACRLNAWIDFNANGAWEDGEQIFDGDRLAAEQYSQLTFAVPETTSVDMPLYSRWRCSTERDLGYDGEAPDGEVEDYVVTVTDEGRPMDLGDLPDEYGTLLGSGIDGPYHLIVPGFGLGGTIDDEMDGHPSVDANGDDLCPPTGGDDEDGITLPEPIQADATNVISVCLTNSAGYQDPVLYAWVDASVEDGFEDVVPQVFTETVLPPGGECTNIQVDVPAAGAGSPIYFRFRLTGTAPGSLLSSAGVAQEDLGPTGGADNGEVEDYVGYTPTAVLLNAFRATPLDRAIQVTWETATEVNLLGFRLYRAEAAAGARTQLTPELIAVQHPGSPTGARYRYVDQSVTLDTQYFYWLEMVDVYGGQTEHGPAVAAVPWVPQYYRIYLPLATPR